MSEQDIQERDAEEYTDLSPQFARDILDALGTGQARLVEEKLADLHVSDIAHLLGWASQEERFHLVEILRTDFDAEILPELSEEVKEEVIDQLGFKLAAEAISELDSDEQVEVIEDLDEEDQLTILQALPQDERVLIETQLNYPEYTAGRLMQREVVAVPDFWTVGQAIDYTRSAQNLPDDFYDIFVTDPRQVPVGVVPLSRLMRTNRPIHIKDLMKQEELRTIPVTMEQEDIAHLFRQRDLVSAPVVDEAGRLVGAITVDDVVDIIDEEHEEDIMRMAGVGEEDDLDSGIWSTAKGRFTWLAVNSLTAILAASVIGLFEATIDQMVALAILMPIVASMGGNAGMQTLTVAVRSLATRELSSTNAPRVISKEVRVAVLNGIAFAVLIGAIAGLWFQNPLLGGVIGLAMIINFFTAGLAGTLIPLALEKAGVDPAIASSVFLTTLTDLVGFFAFLGLATVFLL